MVATKWHSAPSSSPLRDTGQGSPASATDVQFYTAITAPSDDYTEAPVF